MSGGGQIIEKKQMVLVDDGERIEVVRYWLVSDANRSWPDEICVYAKPQADEPSEGETIWWGGGKEIYWGPNDSKRLVKVGYSFVPRPTLPTGAPTDE